MGAAGFLPPLHPVLGRVYAARGVRSAGELDNSLERLLPVGTLEGLPRGGAADAASQRPGHDHR